MQPIVVLTGGTGFIGQKLGQALVAERFQVRVLTRNSKRHEKQMAYPCELFDWNDETFSVPKEALQGSYALIHLAGASIASGRWTKERKKKIVDSRVHSSEVLVRALQQLSQPLPIFIQSSAIGFYGDAGERLLTESTPPGDDFLATTCVAWENPAKALDRAKTRVVVMRTGMVFGWEGGALPTLNDVYTAQLGAVLGSGKQWQSWIHVDDLVNLYIHALKDDRVRGPINAVAPEPVRFTTLHRELGARTGSHTGKSVPTAVLNIALGEQAQLFLNSQRVSSEKATDTGFQFRFKKLGDALDHLFAPIREKGSRIVATQQWVEAPEAKVWQFFTDENNLEAITPSLLGFKVLSKSHNAIHEGTRIQYQLKLHGIPMSWESKITDLKERRQFVDIQTKGPYKYWHHTHTFTPFAGGVLISDFVQYKLPLTRWLHGIAGLVVNRDLKQIFQHRREMIPKMLWT